MNRTGTAVFAVMAVVAGFGLAGCDSAGLAEGAAAGVATLAVTPSKTTTPTEIPLTAPSTTSMVDETPRGNLAMGLGEIASLWLDVDNDFCDEEALAFSVDRIEVDPPCDSRHAAKPANGRHYVVLTITAETTELLDPADPLTSTGFLPMHFSVVGPDGITTTSLDGVYDCLTASDMLSYARLAPSSRYAGKVLLNSPYDSGIVVYNPPLSDSGLEWTF